MNVDLGYMDYYGQRAIRVGGDWFGDSAYVEAMQNRLDVILPQNMEGMSLLDIGACHGAFSFEAVDRGADHVSVIERLQPNIDSMQRISDELHMPITIFNDDIQTMEFPLINNKKYSIGLLLNVLHINEDPKSILCKTLNVCEKTIVEVPFCSGGDLIRESDRGDGIRMWQFPPYWMNQVGQNNGFNVSFQTATLAQEHRMLFFFEK